MGQFRHNFDIIVSKLTHFSEFDSDLVFSVGKQITLISTDLPVFLRVLQNFALCDLLQL